MKHFSQKKRPQKGQKGFTLIELIVSMFIFGLLLVALGSVSFAIFQSYQKSKAIKKVVEDIGFAMNSVTKDVRMGKIEADCESSGINDLKKCVVVTRNTTGKTVCYKIADDNEALLLYENGLPGNWCGGVVDPKKLVDLSGTGMTFDPTKSGFYNMKTGGAVTKIRGWVEINLDVESPSASTDSIQAQTIVSSRDYGWELVSP